MQRHVGGPKQYTKPLSEKLIQNDSIQVVVRGNDSIRTTFPSQ